MSVFPCELGTTKSLQGATTVTVGSWKLPILGCPGTEVNGSMVNGSMGYFTDPYKWGMNWGYKPIDPFTIDPFTSNGTSKYMRVIRAEVVEVGI